MSEDGAAGSGGDDGATRSSDEGGAAGSNHEGGTDEPSDDGVLGRTCQRLLAAGQWVADTFRGHSGAHQFEDRER